MRCQVHLLEKFPIVSKETKLIEIMSPHSDSYVPARCYVVGHRLIVEILAFATTTVRSLTEFARLADGNGHTGRGLQSTFHIIVLLYSISICFFFNIHLKLYCHQVAGE